MVYMDPVELGWKPFVKSWMAKLPKAFPEYGNLFMLRCNKYAPKNKFVDAVAAVVFCCLILFMILSCEISSNGLVLCQSRCFSPRLIDCSCVGLCICSRLSQFVSSRQIKHCRFPISRINFLMWIPNCVP